MLSDARVAGPTSQPGLLTGRQLVKTVVPVTERTLFTLRAEGLPHVKLPGRVLYDPAEVVAWLKVRYGVAGRQAAETGGDHV